MGGSESNKNSMEDSERFEDFKIQTGDLRSFRSTVKDRLVNRRLV